MKEEIGGRERKGGRRGRKEGEEGIIYRGGGIESGAGCLGSTVFQCDPMVDLGITH